MYPWTYTLVKRVPFPECEEVAVECRCPWQPFPSEDLQTIESMKKAVAASWTSSQ